MRIRTKIHMSRKARLQRPFSILGLVLMSAILALPSVASAAVGDYRCKDHSDVYLGNARLFKRPCHVSADRIYRKIPEYQEILQKKLTDDDPKYHLLMKKASQRFNEAVKQMARDLDHDLVAEDGAIKKDKEEAKSIPDRTDEVIRIIQGG